MSQAFLGNAFLPAAFQSSIEINPVYIIEDDDTILSSSGVRISAITNISHDDDSISSTSILIVSASVDKTDDNDAIVFTSTIDHAASSSITEENDLSSATAKIDIVAESSISEDDDTVEFGSTILIVANSVNIEVNDVLIADSQVTGQTQLIVHEQDDIISMSSFLKTHIQVDTYEGDEDTSQFTVETYLVAESTIIELDDSLSTQSGVLIVGEHSSTNDNDTIVATFDVYTRGYFTQTDSDDWVSFSRSRLRTFAKADITDSDDRPMPLTGELDIIGNKFAVEDDDTLLSNSALGTHGSVKIRDDNDTLVATGTTNIQAELAQLADADSVESSAGLWIAALCNITEDDDTLLSHPEKQVTADLIEDDDVLSSVGVTYVTIASIVPSVNFGQHEATLRNDFTYDNYLKTFISRKSKNKNYSKNKDTEIGTVGSTTQPVGLYTD